MAAVGKMEVSQESAGIVKCPHVEQATKLSHCDHCNFNFCDSCSSTHKEFVLLDITKFSTSLFPEAPSACLANKLQHATQFLDEDLSLIKQQIGSTIDAIIERFSTFLWSQGSKILSEAEDSVAVEKERLNGAVTNVDMTELDAKTEELRQRTKHIQNQNIDDITFESLGKLSKDLSTFLLSTADLELTLSVNHRVRVCFELNSELESAVHTFDAVKLGTVSITQTGMPIHLTRPRSDSCTTDLSYSKVTLTGAYHGNDAFGDSIYLPHAICAMPDSHLVALLHGEYRVSIMSCATVGSCCVIATYHVLHPANAPASLPMHGIACDKSNLYVVGDARGTYIATFSVDSSNATTPDRRTIVPKTFAKSWSDQGFRGLAVGHKVRWLYTADGDTISAYSLDSGVPTFRRIGTFPSDFQPVIYDVFPDGITLVYASKDNRKTTYWRAFPVSEDSRKNTELVKSSRHYVNHRDTFFGGAAVDASGNLILCDDRSLQIFYRHAFDVPVSTFPLPLAHDEQAPTAHTMDTRGIAVLPCGVPITSDTSAFKESFSSIIAVADCSAHRILLFNISG